MTNEWFIEERIHIGARCAGAMERLLTLALEWATERVQFGQRIYDFQGVKTLLDTVGGGAPVLRGALEAFRAIADVARWEGRHAARAGSGPWRHEWPALAADRTSYGADPEANPAIRAPAMLTTLPERESLAFLAAAGIPVTAATAVVDAAGAVYAARTFGGAVALKLDAAGLSHKSDLGGVALGLLGDDAVHAAALDLLEVGRQRDLVVRGLLVEPMAAPGVELIVGLRRDPQFGPAVVLGLGGVLAEVMDDVAIRLAPLDEAAGMSMLDDLRGAGVLRGVCGRPAIDRQALVNMLVAIGRLGVDRVDILEIDLNPVIASASGALAVDAIVVLEGSPA